MKILYLSHRIPYPPNKGDKIRSFNEVKYLSKHHYVDIACLADDPADLKFKKNLAEFGHNIHVEPLYTSYAKIRGLLSLLSGKPISVGYFHSKKLQQVIDRWLLESAYDAVICFSSPMAEYILRALCPAPLPSLLMDFCDVDSEKWYQYSANTKFPMKMLYKSESRRLLEYEKKINRKFNHSIFVSQKEADLFRSLVPEARNIAVIPNGVDSDFFSPDAVPIGNAPFLPGNKVLKLMFAGAMDYHANIDGVTWFSREIFPQLQNHFSNLKFTIVGSNPATGVKALAKGNNIQVTGFVEDIRPYYAAVDICVIPLRLARGVQNKVLEAMAMGKAIVTTSAAIQGISATNGQHLLVADTADGFTQAIEKLLKNPDLRKQLGVSARDFVINQYSWNNHMEKLNCLISTNITNLRINESTNY